MRTSLLAFLLAASAAAAAPKAEILWDQYGVPHIFAADRESMFYADGWAQAQGQANLLLLLYGESRGRAAEYWGAIASRAGPLGSTQRRPRARQAWYAAQDPDLPQIPGRLCARHQRLRESSSRQPSRPNTASCCPSPASTWSATPCAPSTTCTWGPWSACSAKSTRTSRAAASWRRTLLAEEPELTAGSNTWAIGPPHSASGKSMLIINPHLAWGDTFYRYMEVHLVGPGYDLYGAPQIGFPDARGRLQPARRLGPHRQYHRHRRFLRAQGNGRPVRIRRQARATSSARRRSSRSNSRTDLSKKRNSRSAAACRARWSTTRTASSIAMRVAGLDRPKMLEQWFRMGEATQSGAVQERAAADVRPDVECQLRRCRRPHHDGLRRPGAETEDGRSAILGRGGSRRYFGDHVDRLPLLRRTAQVARSALRLPSEHQ